MSDAPSSTDQDSPQGKSVGEISKLGIWRRNLAITLLGAAIVLFVFIELILIFPSRAAAMLGSASPVQSSDAPGCWPWWTCPPVSRLQLNEPSPPSSTPGQAPSSAANPPQGRNSNVPAASPVFLPLTSGDVVRQLEILNLYAPIVEQAKILFALFTAILLGGIAALGTWFVQANMEKFKSEAMKQSYDLLSASGEKFKSLTQELETSKTELEEAQEELEAFQARLKQDIDAELKYVRVDNDHAIALLTWRAGELDEAIDYAKRGLTFAKELLANPEQLTEVRKKDLEDWILWLELDLAYFYAERFGSKGTEEDAVIALTHARTLPATVKDMDDPRLLNRADNYMFAVSLCKPLVKTDKDTFLRYFEHFLEVARKDYEFPKRFDRSKTIERYERFANEIRSSN